MAISNLACFFKSKLRIYRDILFEVDVIADKLEISMWRTTLLTMPKIASNIKFSMSIFECSKSFSTIQLFAPIVTLSLIIYNKKHELLTYASFLFI